MDRKSGVLLHISSLSGSYGIGSLGAKAYEFVDFLVDAGQSHWQVLPVCPTSYGDSPYQSFSVFAGNPYFIDLDMLLKENLIYESDLPTGDANYSVKIDYARLYEQRPLILRRAYEKGYKKYQDEIGEFVKDNKFWIEDYALFMAIKYDLGGGSWTQWPIALKKREVEAIKPYKARLVKEIEMYIFVQFIFFRQFNKLKKYANDNGIAIIGDAPIYAASDSSDVWSRPEIFQLDEDLNMTALSGVPPDNFSVTGQLWGNPLYRWDEMKKDGYSWWITRIHHYLELYDFLRIDHFRGFEQYCTIDADAKSALEGEWVDGPGLDFFKYIDKETSERILAEDLGLWTDSLAKFMEDVGYPGMKVLIDGFDPNDDSAYLPHNYVNECIAYTSTHDSKTLMQWYEETIDERRDFANHYCDIKWGDDVNWKCIRAIWQSCAGLVITPMQDILGLGAEARMNFPSTLGQNWMWRMGENDLKPKLAKRLDELTKLYKR